MSAPATPKSGSAKQENDSAAPVASELQFVRKGATAAVAGSSEYFTGNVTLSSRFQAAAPGTVGGALVNFPPGARTAWHTHPRGQTLYVTEGAGYVQRWEGAVEKILPGDIVFIPAEVKHWHGAQADTAMTHLAFADAEDGVSVRWLDPVTDDEYPG